MKFNLWQICGVVLVSLVFGGTFSAKAHAYENYASVIVRLAAQAERENDVRADLETQLFNLANAYRASQGVRKLVVDPATVQAARAHAMDMMINKFMGHSASSGYDFESRMRAIKGGVTNLPLMGENAARVSKPGVVNSATAAGLFQQWVKSAPHRHNLLNRNYVKVSTGVVSRGGVLYADMIFTQAEAEGLY
jgi:uncharacterized protein YkwD